MNHSSFAWPRSCLPHGYNDKSLYFSRSVKSSVFYDEYLVQLYRDHPVFHVVKYCNAIDIRECESRKKREKTLQHCHERRRRFMKLKVLKYFARAPFEKLIAGKLNEFVATARDECVLIFFSRAVFFEGKWGRKNV